MDVLHAIIISFVWYMISPVVWVRDTVKAFSIYAMDKRCFSLWYGLHCDKLSFMLEILGGYHGDFPSCEDKTCIIHWLQ